MANYEGQFRTSYFMVKDADAFCAWAQESFGLTVVHRKDGEETVYAVYSYGGEPSYDMQAEEDIDDFAAVLAEHLAEGWTAIGMCIGNEKMRYLTGVSWAVNWKGEVAAVSLEDIYFKASKEIEGHYTEATY